jgi:hypothetical protein
MYRSARGGDAGQRDDILAASAWRRPVGCGFRHGWDGGWDSEATNSASPCATSLCGHVRECPGSRPTLGHVSDSQDSNLEKHGTVPKSHWPQLLNQQFTFLNPHPYRRRQSGKWPHSSV